MAIVKIKEISRKGYFGLDKYDKSKMPNTVEKIQPALGRDGRWKTGFDENAMSINSISDTAKRNAEKKKAKEMRESFERIFNVDLSGTSSYWENYWVNVVPGKVLDTDNPQSLMQLSILTNSLSVAPSLKDSFDMKYKDAKFYLERENEDVSDKVTKRQRINEANIAFHKLMKTPDKAVQIGQLLGLRITDEMPYDNKYALFQQFLDDDEKTGSIDKFMDLLNKSPEDIALILLVSNAIKYQVIRQRDGLYQRGNITLGRTQADVRDFLRLPENSGEVISIREEIEFKRKNPATHK